MPDADAPRPHDRFHGTDDDFDGTEACDAQCPTFAHSHEPPPDAIDIDPADIVPPPTSRSAATATTTVAPDLETARHAEAFASAQAAVARFRALSDAAGNPGAPTVGHWDASNPPPIPDPTPGPGVAAIAAVHPGETLATGLNRIGAQLDYLTGVVAGLAGRLQAEGDTTHAKLDAIAARLPLRPTVERTLSAMDRVTQWDAEQVIHNVLTAAVRDGQVCDESAAGDLANDIAVALYGPTTAIHQHGCPRCGHSPEGHESYTGPCTVAGCGCGGPPGVWTMPGERGPEPVVLPDGATIDPARSTEAGEAPWPLCAVCGRTLRDCDCRPDAAADEGAPTEGDRRGRGPLIPPENWTSADTEADDDDPDDQIPPNGAFHGHAHDDYGRER